jgi:hypothetical protein
MKIEDRKAAIAAYKKHKSVAGVFAVRCEGTGQVWVGQTLNLGTVQNRIWFSLRAGGHSNADLQRAWSVHGGNHFTFEALERLEDEEVPYVRDKLLKEREIHWRAALDGLSV